MELRGQPFFRGSNMTLERIMWFDTFLDLPPLHPLIIWHTHPIFWERRRKKETIWLFYQVRREEHCVTWPQPSIKLCIEFSPVLWLTIGRKSNLSGVKFINILRAAFAQIFFYPKITKLVYNKQTSCEKMRSFC